MTKLQAFSVLLATLAFGGLVPRTVQADTSSRNLKAREFLDIWGVNVHFNENGYRDVHAVADALNFIGVSRVRSSCTSESEVAAWKQLAAKTALYFPKGLKADVLINGYLNAPDVTFTGQQKLIPQIAPFLESFEGPNEINNYYVGHGTHGPFDTSDQTKNFAANSLAWAKALSEWQKSTPSLAKVNLIAPSIASGDPSDYSQLPNVSPYVGSGNIHFYAGNGRPPSGFGGGNFAAIYGWYQAAATPGKSLAVTECGQTTASKAGQGGCDEATQAKYILNQMCDAAARGATKAYFYQLMDDTSNGDPTGSGGTESHFGLFDYRWSPKLAALALATVKNLLADTSTQFKAKVPAYTVSGITHAGAAGSSFSFSKSDGSTFLVVWNEPPLWDSQTNAPVSPPTDNVTVNFGGRYSYSVYDPLAGRRPVAIGRGSQVKVNVLGSPIFLRIIPTR